MLLVFFPVIYTLIRMTGEVFVSDLHCACKYIKL